MCVERYYIAYNDRLAQFGSATTPCGHVITAIQLAAVSIDVFPRVPILYTVLTIIINTPKYIYIS